MIKEEVEKRQVLPMWVREWSDFPFLGSEFRPVLLLEDYHQIVHLALRPAPFCFFLKVWSSKG